MLSVIIPVGEGRVYNLNLVLSALCMQSFKDFEVILCCDSNAFEYEDLVTKYSGVLDLHSSWEPRKGRLNLGAVNRNRGAQLAKNDCLVFLDSDVVLNKEALYSYAEDFWNYPVRAICGPYHWLPPMEVTEHDLRHNWARFVAGELPKTGKPPYSHNVHKDPRLVPWDTVSSDALYCDYRRAIMILSGNLAVHKDVYRHAGGFWEQLQCGVDGAFGLAVYQSGHSWSFNTAAVGYHLYHERVKGVNGEESTKKIMERFHTDDSWLGSMNTRVGWHWDSRNG